MFQLDKQNYPNALEIELALYLVNESIVFDVGQSY